MTFLDLLVLEKASSRKRRVRTALSTFTIDQAPRDRGGRMGEVMAPARETFGQQQHQREGRGGHGRGRGGGGYRGHGHGGGGHSNFFDQFGRRGGGRNAESQVSLISLAV